MLPPPAADPATETRTDIQSLRGLAVLMVVLYHAELGTPRAGFLGVDVFFVISGYLITGLICRDLDRHRFSFVGFYWRRAKRLLPAAFATFAATALAAPFVLTSLELRSFWMQLAGALSFSANIVLAQQAGYFDTAAALKPLLHVWSLSLEEQYYLLAPAVLWLLPARHRAVAIAAVLMLSFALCLAFVRSKPEFAFFSLPTRAWELGIGSLLAALPPPRLRPAMAAAIGTAALALLIFLPLHPLDIRHPRFDALAVCIATAVTIAAPTPLLNRGPAAFVLSRLGDISYSLYLVHWPLFALLRHLYLGPPPLAARLIALSAAFGLAAALYRWIERPCHRAEIAPSVRWLTAAAGAALVMLAIPALALHQRGKRVDWAALRQPNWGLDARCDDVAQPRPAALCQTKQQPAIAVWGDSYAMHLLPGLAATDPGHGVAQFTRSSCAPVLREAGPNASHVQIACAAFNRRTFAEIAADPGIRFVVLASADPTQDIAETAGLLRAAGKKVIYVAPPPTIGLDLSICAERLIQGLPLLDAPAGCAMPLADARAHPATALAELNRLAPEVPILSPLDAFCDDQSCRSIADGAPLYRDGGHLSRAGSEWYARRADLIGRIVTRAR